MANHGATDPDLLPAAFALIGDEGWRGFSFDKLARCTGVSRVEIYRQFHSRGALLSALTRRADEAMLEIEEAELAEKFPGEYGQYCLRTRWRYLPGLR